MTGGSEIDQDIDANVIVNSTDVRAFCSGKMLRIIKTPNCDADSGRTPWTSRILLTQRRNTPAVFTQLMNFFDKILLKIFDTLKIPTMTYREKDHYFDRIRA